MIDKKSDMKKHKRYLPLANAADHRKAIAVFAFISSLPASFTSLVLIIWITPLYGATREMIVSGVLAGAFAWLAIWGFTFAALVAAYMAVIAEQYQGHPTPPEKVPPVTFYQTETGWIRGKEEVGQGGKQKRGG